MNIKRGLKRLYGSLITLWIVVVIMVFPLTIERAWQYDYWDNMLRVVTTPRMLPLLGWAILPPAILSLCSGLILWIVRGFRKDTDTL